MKINIYALLFSFFSIGIFQSYSINTMEYQPDVQKEEQRKSLQVKYEEYLQKLKDFKEQLIALRQEIPEEKFVKHMRDNFLDELYVLLNNIRASLKESQQIQDNTSIRKFLFLYQTVQGYTIQFESADVQ